VKEGGHHVPGKDGLIHKFDDVSDFIKAVAPKSKTMNEAFTTFYATSKGNGYPYEKKGLSPSGTDLIGIVSPD
jgi:hypothetical protein